MSLLIRIGVNILSKNWRVCDMREHFLTFILPCYNYADIIEQSLVSVYQQDNLKVPFEVICTDDCSSDSRTPEILKKWENDHSNFRVFLLEGQPRGECFANNHSIRNSQGDIFFCLDTDNVLVPNSVQGLIDLLDSSGCDGACFEELRFFKDVEGKRVPGDVWKFKAPNNIVDIRHICSTGMTPASSGNYLFTKESWERAGGYPDGNVMGSWSFGFRQHATGGKIAILPNTFYWHRFSDGGMYLTNQKKGLNGKAMMDTVLEFKHLFTGETLKVFETEECKRSFTGCCQANRIKLK